MDSRVQSRMCSIHAMHDYGNYSCESMRHAKIVWLGCLLSVTRFFFVCKIYHLNCGVNLNIFCYYYFEFCVNASDWHSGRTILLRKAVK